MRQAIIGVSIFIGLQLAFAIVLVVATAWEARQLDRSRSVPARAPKTSQGAE